MQVLSRQRAIADLRHKLLELVDDDHSMCQVASEHKIFCSGFSQWSVAELEERYWWLLQNRPKMTRKKLEDMADRWQLARQFVRDTELSCDTQGQVRSARSAAAGTFHRPDLARHYRAV
jgi:hypothetical protein